MRSECFCDRYSCENLNIKIGSEYQHYPAKRFRFEKDDGIIFDGGIVPNDIATCELKCRVSYRDKDGNHPTGHDLRSIANDHRKGKSHRKHWTNTKGNQNNGKVI
jgi:hypothetical protein